MRLRYTQRALRQLFAILDFIEQRSPRGAESIAARLEETVAIVKNQPLIGVATQRPGFWRFMLSPYPYVILYQPKDNEIVIHSLRHAAR